MPGQSGDVKLQHKNSRGRRISAHKGSSLSDRGPFPEYLRISYLYAILESINVDITHVKKSIVHAGVQHWM